MANNYESCCEYSRILKKSTATTTPKAHQLKLKLENYVAFCLNTYVIIMRIKDWLFMWKLCISKKHSLYYLFVRLWFWALDKRCIYPAHPFASLVKSRYAICSFFFHCIHIINFVWEILCICFVWHTPALLRTT